MHWKKWLLGAILFGFCVGASGQAVAEEPTLLKKSLLGKTVLAGGLGVRSGVSGFTFRLGRGLKSHGFIHGRHGVFLVHPRQWGLFDGSRFFPRRNDRRVFLQRWSRRQGMSVHGSAAYTKRDRGQSRSPVWSTQDLGVPGWEEDLGPSGWHEDLGFY